MLTSGFVGAFFLREGAALAFSSFPPPSPSILTLSSREVVGTPSMTVSGRGLYSGPIPNRRRGLGCTVVTFDAVKFVSPEEVFPTGCGISLKQNNYELKKGNSSPLNANQLIKFLCFTKLLLTKFKLDTKLKEACAC